MRMQPVLALAEVQVQSWGRSPSSAGAPFCHRTLCAHRMSQQLADLHISNFTSRRNETVRAHRVSPQCQ